MAKYRDSIRLDMLSKYGCEIITTVGTYKYTDKKLNLNKESLRKWIDRKFKIGGGK